MKQHFTSPASDNLGRAESVDSSLCSQPGRAYSQSPNLGKQLKATVYF